MVNFSTLWVVPFDMTRLWVIGRGVGTGGGSGPPQPKYWGGRPPPQLLKVENLKIWNLETHRNWLLSQIRQILLKLYIFDYKKSPTLYTFFESMYFIVQIRKNLSSNRNLAQFLLEHQAPYYGKNTLLYRRDPWRGGYCPVKNIHGALWLCEQS